MKIINVLIVDDDPNLLKLLTTVLEEAGFGTATAESGARALAMLETFKPELIISDVNMPGMNGWELCRRVRGMGHDDIPFVFCSVEGSQRHRIEGLRLGADAYLVKPIDPAETVLTVKRLIEKNRRLLDLGQEVGDAATGAVMTGRLEEVSLAEVLQILDYRGRGALVVRVNGRPGNEGRIYVSGRRLVHAELGRHFGWKAFSRLLGWSAGWFRVDREVPLAEPTLDQPIAGGLLEGYLKLDETRALLAELSERGVRYRRVAGLIADLDDEDRLLLDQIEPGSDLEQILERSRREDGETLQSLKGLLDRGLIRPGLEPGS